MARIYENDTVMDYIHQTFVSEDALLKKVHAKGEELRPGMQVSPYEGKMLHLFCRMIGAKRVLEIGAFVGYSTIWMSRALPADGQVITCEADATHAEIARGHAAENTDAAPIDVREGKALDTLKMLQQEAQQYDVVFMDAMKREYMDYLEMSLPMLRTGGLMIADNSLLFGHVVGQGEQKISPDAVDVMKAVNTRLAGPEFDGLMMATQEGLTVGVKK